MCCIDGVMASSPLNRPYPTTVFACFLPALLGIAVQVCCAAAPQLHPAVARVSVQESGAVSHGSATLVAVRDGKAMVVTNWHVVRDAAGPISVHFPNGFQSPARVLKWDKDWDLAALLVWDPGVAPVPIANRPSQLGEPLVIAGYGSGRFRAAAGRCTQYVAPGVNMPYEMVEVSVQARQGDSGGPILNQRGELAGVLFGSGSGTTSGSYAGRVRQFLATAWPATPQPDVTQVARDASPMLPPVGRSEAPEQRELPPQIAKVPDVEQTPSPPVVHRMPPSPPPSHVADPAAHPEVNRPETAAVPPPAIPFRSSPAARRDQATVDAPSGESFEITWESLAGKTIAEQAKSVLAMIGACAIVLHLLRIGKKE